LVNEYLIDLLLVNIVLEFVLMSVRDVLFLSDNELFERELHADNIVLLLFDSIDDCDVVALFVDCKCFNCC
jgi:hypothetical protein